LIALVLIVAGLAGLTGCSGADGSATSSGADLSADTSSGTPIGHYVLGAAGSGNDDQWLNEINLHKDGTFDGNFGNAVSNLSGHYFLANGTYTFGSTSAGKTLELTYSYDGQSGTGSYLYTVERSGLRLQSADDTSEPAFTMDSAAAPITLSFAADGSAPGVHTAHAGDTLLLRYSAARLKCGGNGAGLAALASLDSPQPSVVDSVNEVDGYYDFLVPVAEGKKLSIWFENTNEQGCVFWDSNASQNFVVTID
jgi:hypothetical protein